MLKKISTLLRGVFSGGMKSTVPERESLCAFVNTLLLRQTSFAERIELSDGGSVTDPSRPADATSRSGKIVTFVDESQYLPDPECLLGAAERERAEAILVIARDPVPCNTPEIPQIEGPAYPISVWEKRSRDSGFTNFKMGFRHENGNACLILSKDLDLSNIIDQFAMANDRVLISDSLKGKILVSPHSGWKEDAVFDGLGTLYLLNRSREPLRLQVEISFRATDDTARVCAHHNLCYLHEFSISSVGETTITLSDVFLFPGGHGIQFLSAGGHPVEMVRCEISGDECPREEFQISLPFDKYQRHKVVGDALNTFIEDLPKNAKVLDVGGGYGLTTMFADVSDITVLESRQHDIPWHIKGSGEGLPFGSDSFDVVVSVDTLEHVPSSARESFINDLWRVTNRYLLLACPFQNDSIDKAERIFADFEMNVRGHDNAFLNEHITNGLPDRDETIRLIEDIGGSVAAIPNGYLPRWLSMMLLNSAVCTVPEHLCDLPETNRRYNAENYPIDNSEPCYRYLLAVSKNKEDSYKLRTISDLLVSSSSAGHEALLSPEAAMDYFGVHRTSSADEWLKEHEQELENLWS